MDRGDGAVTLSQGEALDLLCEELMIAADEGPMKPTEVHKVLEDAYAQLKGLIYELEDVRTDTAAAIGYATGALSKAKALVGRDIDDAAA